MNLNEKFLNFLRWSEKYAQTDMVYVVKGGFWILLGKIGILLLAFIKMVIWGRFLPKEVYGVYVYIIAVIDILVIFSLPGINTSLIKAIAQKKEGTLNLAIKEKLKFSLIGSLIALFLFFYYLFNQKYTLAYAFLGGAVFFPFANSFPIYLSFWVGRKRFDVQNKYEFISASLIVLFSVPVIFFTNNVVFIVLALFVSQAVFNGLFLGKTLKNQLNNEVSPEIIPFGKSLTIINSISLFANQIDKIIIWQILGPTSVAVYSFAQLPVVKIFGIIPISPLALPKLVERNVKEIKEGIIKKVKKLFFVVVPFVFLIFFFAPWVYKIIFPQYLDSVPYFRVLSLSLLFIPFSLFSASLVTERKKKELYIIENIVPLLKIILFIVLIPLYGIWGMVFAAMISIILYNILRLYYFKKI